MSIINFGGIYDRLASLTNKVDAGVAAPQLAIASPSPRVGLQSAFIFDTANTATNTSGSLAYDSTIRRSYYQNSTGSASSSRATSTSGMFHQVEVAPFYGLTTSVNGVALPAYMTGPALWVEFYGKWPQTVAAVNDDCGWGVSSTAPSSATPFSSARRFLSFYRKATSGWTLVSADGSTRSETSEASDTSDAAFHRFRIKYDIAAAEAYLYVDDVLKVTKTANLPAWLANASSFSTTGIGARASTAEATGTWQLYGMASGWGD